MSYWHFECNLIDFTGWALSHLCDFKTLSKVFVLMSLFLSYRLLLCAECWDRHPCGRCYWWHMSNWSLLSHGKLWPHTLSYWYLPQCDWTGRGDGLYSMSPGWLLPGCWSDSSWGSMRSRLLLPRGSESLHPCRLCLPRGPLLPHWFRRADPMCQRYLPGPDHHMGV